MQIDKTFRAANIEIAFPQQEIHLDDRSKKLVQQVLDTIDQFRGGASLKSEEQSLSAAGTDLTVAAKFAAIEGAVEGAVEGAITDALGSGREEASLKKAG